ncbi:polyprenyl synthetase family protein [Halosquirtibacter laminarini]|uniref:Polyprenyl synthetase family protein n=1 Tax=Halosquirtibacter laminarini TaxID=3374600 RepID=A0AC61NK27_9BACT|nr:polyprenyl synthetase family protein [Prolixibacteraceae bacterium]
MKKNDNIQIAIEKRIQEEVDFLNNMSPNGLYAPIAYALSNGGKRFRPRLLLMAMEMFSEVTNIGLDAAMAVEVFHNFTLLHDDIMDGADLRRGKETVHRKYDANTAILSGDAMMIYAYKKLEGLDAVLQAKVQQVFTQTALEVCEGQQYDIEFETRDFVAIEEYLEMIKLKTAVLLAASLKIGAIIAGANNEDADLIYQFGLKVGISFQIQDDILDVYGDAETFGKQIGGDIVSNKKTILMLLAQKSASKVDGKLLEHWLSKEIFNKEEKISSVTSIYNSVGVREQAETLQQEYFDEALESLDAISVSVARKQPLRTVAISLFKRNV